MTTMLAEPEVLEIPDDGKGPLFEIVDGRRRDKPMSMLAQWVGAQIVTDINIHLRKIQVGGFAVTETFIACFDWAPDTQRRPDVAYWHREQYPDGLPPRGVARQTPAWCVEVVSPGDHAEELQEKIEEYFRAGVELVWVVNPSTRTIQTQQPDGTAHVYRAAEAITAMPVLPDFSAAVGDFFPAARDVR